MFAFYFVDLQVFNYMEVGRSSLSFVKNEKHLVTGLQTKKMWKLRHSNRSNLLREKALRLAKWWREPSGHSLRLFKILCEYRRCKCDFKT